MRSRSAQETFAACVGGIGANVCVAVAGTGVNVAATGTGVNVAATGTGVNVAVAGTGVNVAATGDAGAVVAPAGTPPVGGAPIGRVWLQLMTAISVIADISPSKKFLTKSSYHSRLLS